jgi:hypothetical protein
MVDAVVFDTRYPSARAIADVLESTGSSVLRVTSVAEPGAFFLEPRDPASIDALSAEVDDALELLVLDQSGLFLRPPPWGGDPGLFDFDLDLAVGDVVAVVEPQLALTRALLPVMENSSRQLVVTCLDRVDHGRRGSAGQSIAATAAARIGAIGAAHHGQTIPWITIGGAAVEAQGPSDPAGVLPDQRARAARSNFPTFALAGHVIAALARMRFSALGAWLGRPHDTVELGLGLGLTVEHGMPETATPPDEESVRLSRAYRRQFTGD